MRISGQRYAWDGIGEVLAAGLLLAAVIGANLVFLAVVALPISWSWNGAVVPLFHASRMEYAHAWWLILLCRLVKTAIDGIQLSAEWKDSR